jgi:serine/threonine protein kinase
MPLSTGQTLNNRYRIVKLLGQGGYGAVYRAWDLNMQAPVAVKECFDTSPSAQRQFQTEARLLFTLNHPNLPRVFDHFTLPGMGQYLVMNYIEGEDLHTMLARSAAPLPQAQALAWLTQVCEALEYLHKQVPPVIHRDIKPANIRITPAGKAMLVDFGIAKVFDPVQKTTVGARAVTPGYSPPEQYGQGTTDTRSDVYSLGATLYTLLTGQKPVESVFRITSQPLTSPRQLNPAIAPSTESIILKAMELGPETRFQAISDLQDAITRPVGIPLPTEKVSQVSPQSDSTSLQAPLPSTPASAPPHRSPWVWLGIGGALVAGCLLLVVAGAYFLSQSSPAPTARPTRTAKTQSELATSLPVIETALPGTGMQDQSPATLPVSAPLATDPVTAPAPTQAPLPTLALPPTTTFTPLPPPTAVPVPTPDFYGFQACNKPCNQSGAITTSEYPEGATAIYFQWRYANIPTNAQYMRAWYMDGQEWVRYECTWPGPSDGVYAGSLTEPDGLHSGTWTVEIYVDGVLRMQGQVYVAGNWTYWSPAGTFNTCTGKK